MASSPPTAYHRSLEAASMDSLKNKQMFLDQLMKENFGLKLKIFHLEESCNKHNTLEKSAGQNPELSLLVEGIKKELAEKNKQLMQARAMVFHYEKEIEKLNQDLDTRPQREEVCALEFEKKDLEDKLRDTEKKLSYSLKDVEKANLALENAEAMNEKLQAEIGEFNKEFRYRLESLEHEVSSQTLKPAAALENKSVQADIENPLHLMMKANCESMAEELRDVKYKKEMESQRVHDLEGQVQQLQNALLQRDKQVKSLMGQVESLKVEFAEENSNTIQDLKWKIEETETKVKDMEAQLQRKEKEAINLSNSLIESEKEKWTMKGTLKELEAALVASETNLRNATEDKDKYVKSLEKMHQEIEELSKQYQESVQSNGDCGDKDVIISQLQREVQLLNSRLHSRTSMADKTLKEKVEVNDLTRGMKMDEPPRTMAEASLDSLHSYSSWDGHHKTGNGLNSTKEHELFMQIRLAEQLLLEKEEDLYFMEETLRRSKKELQMALSDIAFYQELIGHLQKDALMYLEFVQDIRSAAASGCEERGQKSLRELVRAHLQKLDLKIEDSVRPQLRLSCGGSHESFGEVTMAGTPSSAGDNKETGTIGKSKTDGVRNSSGSCSKSTSADTAPCSKLETEDTNGSNLKLSNHGQHVKSRDKLMSSEQCSPRLAGFSGLASLESRYHKTLTSSSSKTQVADHVFVEDLLLYLKSQHKKMDENQNRLERLERQTSGCEETTESCSVLPKSAHISDIQGNTPAESKRPQGQFTASSTLSSSSCSSSSASHHTHSFTGRFGPTRGSGHNFGIVHTPTATSQKTYDEQQDTQSPVMEESFIKELKGKSDYRLTLDSSNLTKNVHYQ